MSPALNSRILIINKGSLGNDKLRPMNSRPELVAFIVARVQQLARDKGLPPRSLNEASTLLNGGIDSLDLAALVVELQEKTNRDPFENGLVPFESVSELAELYAS